MNIYLQMYTETKLIKVRLRKWPKKTILADNKLHIKCFSEILGGT